MTLTAAERLEGEYALTPEELGMSGEVFTKRLALWERLAAERFQVEGEARQSYVAYLALTAWVAYLIDLDDKFRAEGDIMAERNIMARIGVIQQYQTQAALAAGLPVPGAPPRRVSTNPAPTIEPWELR